MNQPFSYISGHVSSGAYRRIIAYWDVNDNGKYDSGDLKDDSARAYDPVLFISPGIPTARVDMVIK